MLVEGGGRGMRDKRDRMDTGFEWERQMMKKMKKKTSFMIIGMAHTHMDDMS